MSSTTLQAQNAIRPITGFGITEGVHLGLGYRMKNLQLYAGYGQFKTSLTYSDGGHFFWGGAQVYFGDQERAWHPWYIKLGIFRIYESRDIGEREYELECRLGREFFLSDKLSLAVDLGLSRDLEDFHDIRFAYLPQGGVYFLYNL